MKNKDYKTGIANCPDNVIKQGMKPKKWKILYDYCLAQKKSIKVLDVGCGTGNKMLFLLKKGYRNVWGIEYNKDIFLPLIKSCPQLRIKEGNAEKLSDLRDNFFDLVYCCHVLEHLPNPNSAVKEANRVLKKGGAYIVGIPNGGHLNDKITRLVQFVFYRKSDHLQTFSARKISLLLEKNGFDILKFKARRDSLRLLLDKRSGNGFISGLLKIAYKIVKKIYFRELEFDILAIKK